MAVKPIIKGFEYFLERLLKGFRSVEKREPNNLEMILIKQEAGQKARDANKVIKVDFGEPFGEQIKKGMFDDIFNKMYTDYKGGPKGVMKLVESGDVKLGKADKTPPYQKSQADIEQEIYEKLKADNEKAVKAFESRNTKKLDEFNLSEDDPVGDLEKIIKGEGETGLPKKPKKPRDEKYTGGLVDVEPSLSDIGHGSDALMARTRLMSPGSQATTSTGLNYLLAEDNDNIRVPFGDGLRPIDKGFFITPPDPYEGLSSEEKEMRKALDKIMSEKFQKKLSPEDVEKIKIQQEIRKRQAEEMGLPEGLQLMNQGGRTGFAKGKLADAARRKFMKAAGAAGAGITALKTGLLGFGEKAAPVVEKVAETVSETAQSVPPYFFNLVNKIKTMGDETMATQDKAIAKKYKDYVMEEDFAGNITIIKKNMDDPYPEEVIMSYKVDDASLPSGKGMAKVDEYEEFTLRPDAEGKMKDIQGGVPDEVVQEGTMFEDNMTEFGKADGGLAKMLGE
jgi:hypothetical protein